MVLVIPVGFMCVVSIQQVEEWSPDLIELEEQAKNVRRIIKMAGFECQTFFS